MSFKKLRTHILGQAVMAAALIISLAGCALNEGPAPHSSRNIKDGDGCLQDFRVKLEGYFEGKLDDRQIDGLGKCVTDAISRFQFVVKGRTRDTFSAAEIRDFLQYYYLEDFELTDSLLTEIMRVKTALIGGGTEKFTLDDLERAKEMIRTVVKQLQVLRPYMPITPDHLKKASLSEVEAAIVALRSVAGSLASNILNRDPSYSFEDLDRLLDEVEKIFPDLTELKQLRARIPLLASIKEVLLNPESDRNRISAEDWKILLQDGTEWASNFLRLMHFHQNYGNNMFQGEGRERLSLIVNDIFTLLQKIPARHNHRHCVKQVSGYERCEDLQGLLSFQKLFRLIDESKWEGGLFGTQITPLTVKAELVPLIQRVLGGTDFSARGREAPGLTAEAIERARVAFNEWNEGSRYLEGVFQKLAGDGLLEPSLSFTASDFSRVSVREALQVRGTVTPFAEQVAKDLRTVLVDPKEVGKHPRSGPSFFKEPGRRIHFDYDMRTRPKAFHEVMNHAWIRPLMRLVLSGYLGRSSGEFHRRTKKSPALGLKEHEFTRLIADFWPVLLDLQFIGRTNSPSADSAKRFMEANLFGFAANGDDEIDVPEGTQMILFLLSANAVSGAIMEDAWKHCPKGPNDEFGKPIMLASCFRERLMNLDPANSPLKEIFSGFPHLQSFYASFDEEGRRLFKRKLETPILTVIEDPPTSEADRAHPEYWEQNRWFDSTEADALIMLMHYVEALYMRYDTGGDRGSIDYPESLEALKVFKRTLGKFGEMDPNGSKLRAVFTWLLTRGSPPEKKDYDAFAVWWLGRGGVGGVLRQDSRRYQFECKRDTIVNVFGTISSMAADSSGDTAAADAAIHAEDPWRRHLPDWQKVRISAE